MRTHEVMNEDFVVFFFFNKLSLLPMYYCIAMFIAILYTPLSIVYANTLAVIIRHIKYTGGNYPSYQLHLQ